MVKGNVEHKKKLKEQKLSNGVSKGPIRRKEEEVRSVLLHGSPELVLEHIQEEYPPSEETIELIIKGLYPWNCSFCGVESNYRDFIVEQVVKKMTIPDLLCPDCKQKVTLFCSVETFAQYMTFQFYRNTIVNKRNNFTV